MNYISGFTTMGYWVSCSVFWEKKNNVLGSFEICCLFGWLQCLVTEVIKIIEHITLFEFQTKRDNDNVMCCAEDRNLSDSIIITNIRFIWKKTEPSACQS